MTKAQLFLRKYSSTILTFVGAAGVIGTAVLAVKATPKALELIADETNRQNNEILEEAIANGCETCNYVRKLKPSEVVKVAWKPYIPAAIVGISTIACIFGANYLSRKIQASLMSAYALLDSTYKEYREKTRELYKDDAINIEHEMIKSKFDKDITLHQDKELFFDYQSMRYFESTFEDVKRAEYLLNQKLTTHGYACLNDFYDILGIPHVAYGYQLGWSTMSSDTIYAYSEILLEFKYEKVEMDDGLECNIITIAYPPSLEYIC